MNQASSWQRWLSLLACLTASDHPGHIVRLYVRRPDGRALAVLHSIRQAQVTRVYELHAHCFYQAIIQGWLVYHDLTGRRHQTAEEV